MHIVKRLNSLLEKAEHDKEQQPFEPMEFWGTVSDVFKKDGIDELPEEDDSRVVRLATAMLIFFIVCIILLIVYLACRYFSTFTSICITI